MKASFRLENVAIAQVYAKACAFPDKPIVSKCYCLYLFILSCYQPAVTAMILFNVERPQPQNGNASSGGPLSHDWKARSEYPQPKRPLYHAMANDLKVVGASVGMQHQFLPPMAPRLPKPGGKK